MGANSGIEWTDHTFNPWVGCTKVSPACDHCYAEAWAKRAGTPELWTGARRLTKPSNWNQPLKWDRAAKRAGVRQRVFCASLADVFDNEADPSWRARLLALIARTTNLDWLLLTKRIGNASRMLEDAIAGMCQGVTWKGDPWREISLGATVVNQEEADRDIPKLLATPARRRFLSIEPMLGPIDLERYLSRSWPNCDRGFVQGERMEPGYCGRCAGHKSDPIHTHPETSIDWVIVGGESGPGARPMQRGWVRSLRDQCEEAGVPFFFKQWGEHAPNWMNDDNGREIPGTQYMDRMGKKMAGRILDGQAHSDLPQFGSAGNGTAE